LGATRVVFPRAMAINEMEDVIKLDQSMEYEIFIIHDLCFFDDGLCTYCKEATGGIKKEGRGRNKIYLFSASRIPRRGFGGGCRTRFRRQRLLVSNNKPIGRIRPFTFWMKKHIEGCGACAIYDLKRIGVASLKILDRNLPSEEKVKATRFIRECLDYLINNNLSKSDYIEYCKSRFKKTFKVRCGQFDCYYPSVFLYN
jgi:collagenase-like PrtC family protease